MLNIIVPKRLNMDWENILFLNYKVNYDSIRRLVPSKLMLRSYNGEYYITLVLFNLKYPSVLGLHTKLELPEFNIRTYVKYKNISAIYFLTLDIHNQFLPLLINPIFKLKYFNNYIKYNVDDNSKIIAQWENHEYFHKVFKLQYSNGSILRKNGMSKFITDNYFYLNSEYENVFCNTVYHDEWLLHDVNILYLNGISIFGDLTKPNSAFYCPTMKNVKTDLPNRVKT